LYGFNHSKKELIGKKTLSRRVIKRLEAKSERQQQ
jgi:hypothetical protein